MSAVDISTLREGDTVLVRAVVKDVTMAIGWSVKVTLGNSEKDDQWVTPDIIVSVEPRPLAVGDPVSFAGDVFQIVAISGARAWIYAPAQGHVVSLLAGLVRA